MRRILLLADAVLLSLVFVTAYAFVVSRPVSVSVNIMAPGIIAYTSCGPSGPSNPVTSLNFGTMQSGGSTKIALYLANTGNGTVTIGWNSTIKAASASLADRLEFASTYYYYYYSFYTTYLRLSDCTTTGGFLAYYSVDINGTALPAGDILHVYYVVSSAATPSLSGSYGWNLNIGVQ